MKTSSPHRNSLEPLESRIAPASISVAYTDLDGDLVKITASKTGAAVPPLDATDLTVIFGQLVMLKLTEAGFDGAKIVFSVTKKPGGDGLVHPGFIDATGRDLDQVIVKGDLGKIVAGDATTAGDPGLNLLQVRSMGTRGLFTQAGSGDLDSIITGRLGALKVAGDFTDASLQATGGIDGTIGSVFIGGDLTGGAGAFSGVVLSTGGINDVRVAGNIIGGAGNQSGEVTTNGAMSRVRVGGSIIGGAGTDSGLVFSFAAMGDVRIGGSVIGGAGAFSGRIAGMGGLGDVRIGGDLAGGAGDFSGLLFSLGDMGDVHIGGDLIGGSVTGSATLTDSGEIRSASRIASVAIGGSLIAGSEASTGVLIRCGAIVAGDDIGPVKIRGSIIGNSTNPVVIIATGQNVKPTTGFDLAIASLAVGGDVRFANVLAGFDMTTIPTNADASIGAVSIVGDWVASSLVAGAQDSGPAGFGVGDSLQLVGNTSLVARIASITIKGAVSGSVTSADHFGFVAEMIGKLKIGTKSFTLNAGVSNDDLAIPFTDDTRLSEVI